MTTFNVPFLDATNNLSSPLKLPTNLPLSSPFRRWTAESNQILRASRVLSPFSFSSIRLIGNLVTIFPFEALPLTAISEKSRSILSFFSFASCRNETNTFSASPLGLAVKYNNFDAGLPIVSSYSRSLVMLCTLNRFT